MDSDTARIPPWWSQRIGRIPGGSRGRWFPGSGGTGRGGSVKADGNLGF